ncbi:ABC transporter permease [Aquimarina sp. W85]|uniref:ABC transporter permease n=1 Tax=Aquimarina rhodophyticola TaxID=3342246 RepID=UPI00366EA29E
MLRLLHIEFQKLRYNKAAKVLTATYFILITFIALLASIEFDFGAIHFRFADQGFFNFPYIWHFNTYVASWAKLFLAIIIVSMMANEYSYRTLKQNLIDGLSKKEFIASKFLTVTVFALISTIFVFIISLILGFSFSDYTEFSIITRDLIYIPAYFLKLLAFFSLCMFLGVLVKRSAFALGFLIIWWIFEYIIYGVLKFLVFKNSTIADQIIQFLPLEAMANVIREPFSRLNFVQSAANQLGAGFQKDYAIYTHEILLLLLWTLIFVYLSYTVMRRRDL